MKLVSITPAYELSKMKSRGKKYYKLYLPRGMVNKITATNQVRELLRNLKLNTDLADPFLNYVCQIYNVNYLLYILIYYINI